VAWISGEPGPGALVRVHSECLTGEAFESLKCECGPQLDAALDTIQRDGGIVIYLRGHEGRGIGLINKLRAYRLQEDGFDTLDANLRLGLPADARDYGAATAILADLGVSSVRLLSNNPEKARQLRERGIVSTSSCRSSSAWESSTRGTSTRSATGWVTRCRRTRCSTR
jgi:3,4-dihydroxy 2-butanone 4-phosphate synthase/GTP cyclohydrolase II